MTVWHPDADRLILAALPAEPRDGEVHEHLAACPLCRGQVGTLRRTIGLARVGGAETDLAAPPPRVWQAIAGELDVEFADRPVPVLGPAEGPRILRPESRWRRVAVPVAATLVGLAAGLGIGLGVSIDPDAGIAVARLEPIGPRDPAGSGTVRSIERADRREFVLELEGITDTADADYLEAWLMDASGTRLVALGSLDQDGATFRGTFTVPSDLPTDEYSTVDVSAEKWDGDPAHSRLSLLRGPLT